MKQMYNNLPTLQRKKDFLLGVQSTLSIISGEIYEFAQKNNTDMIIAARKIYKVIYEECHDMTSMLIEDIRKYEKGGLPD